MAAITRPNSDEDEDHYLNMYNYDNSDEEEGDYHTNMYNYNNSDEEDEDHYIINMYYNTSKNDTNNLVSENASHEGMIKRVLRKAMPRRWVSVKWLFLVLNVLLEVCQAAMTEENAKGKISNRLYLTMSVITSCFCLVISVTEMIKEGKDNGVVWRRSGYFYWFYYDGMQGKPRLFGRLSLYLGIVSSTIQLVINSVSLGRKKKVIQFDLLPVLLSSAYLVAEIFGRKAKSEKTMV